MSVLDRNLAQLLRRHRAVTADPQFRQRLEARFVAEVLDAAQSAASAPVPVLRPRFGTPALRRAGLLAAAGVLAMVGAWWLAEGGGPPRTRLDEIVAQSGAALRVSEDGEWKATPDTQFTLPGDYLELAGTGRAELALHLPDSGGEVALLAGDPPRASFARSGESVRVTLLAGRGVLRRPGAADAPLALGHAVLVGGEFAPPTLPEPGAAAPRPLTPMVEAPAPPQPGTLRGLLVRADDGKPVTDARLIIATTDITSEGPKTFTHEMHAADGRFEWAPPPGRYHFFVQAEGLATSITRNVVIDARLLLPELRLELGAGVTVRGRVLEAATGAPVPGALVISDTDAPAIMVALRPEFLRGEQGLDIVRNHALTDADGRFELPGLSIAGQVLRASAPQLAPTWVELPPGPADDVTLSLGEAGDVAGRVLRDDGQPWPRALMIASFNPPEPAGRTMALGVTFTDDEGRYRIGGLPPLMGVVLLIGATDHSARLPPMQAVQVQAGHTATADFGKPRAEGGELSGHMLLPDGTPATGRMLSLSKVGSSVMTDWVGSMVDEAGAYRFAQLAAGSYYVYVDFGTTGEVSFLTPLELGPDEHKQLDLQLAAGALAGHAAAADGSPLAHANVIAMIDSDVGRVFAARCLADENGDWTARALRPGRYWFGIYDARGRWASVQRDGVEVGDALVGGLDTVHPEGGQLELHVVGPDGKARAGAQILLLDADGLSWQLDQNMFTHTDGSLSLAGVPTGVMHVSATEGGSTANGSIVIVAGQSAELKLTLH